MLDALFVAGLFALAWALSRAAAIVARRVLAWHDRLHSDRAEDDLRGRIENIKRRETSVLLIRTAFGYGAFAAAAVIAVARLSGGFDRLTALAGASLFLVLAGFAIQRVLIDVIAGFAMFGERWYSVGDTIAVPTLDLQGVVEDVSLRRTKLRTLDGEVINVHNSQIPAVRVLPTGAKELAMEVFVTDRARAEAALAAVTRILPESPTTFVRRPWVEAVDELGDALVRIRVRATVAPGREWLLDGFVADLLRERAREAIVHGPVTLAVDERATRSFARASAATRWNARRAA